MPKTPSYRRRHGYSQAIVTLTDSASGRRRDYWLGEHGTASSREAYHRLVAAWEAGGRRLPEAATGTAPLPTGGTVANVAGVVADGAGRAISVNELVRAYWLWAKTYYRPTESGTLKVVLRMLRQYYGTSSAAEFGPMKLRFLREQMVKGSTDPHSPREAWSRGYTNQQVQRLRRMFRWGASHELVPAGVYQGLTTVEALKRGRTSAKEGQPVKPVPEEVLDAVRPYLNRRVRALVELQLLTGARSGELLALRPCDIDRTDPSGLWTYRPQQHKTLHRGKDRVIYFGPTAQRHLAPFLDGRDPQAFVFSPAEAEEERRAAVRAARVTPLTWGNAPGRCRVAEPERQPGERYTPASYARSIARACEDAFPPPAHLQPRIHPDGGRETVEAFLKRLSAAEKAEMRAWKVRHRWHPHQLRHNAGTVIRREFGLEAAQLVLGHSSAKLTDAVYAQRDQQKVVDVMRKVG